MGSVIARKAQPDRQRVKYARILREFVRQMHEATLKKLTPVLRQHFDAADDDAKAAIERLRAQLVVGLDTAPIEAALVEVGGDVAKFQAGQLAAALGFDFSALGKPVTAALEGFVADNVALITSMADDYLDGVRQQVEEAFTSGDRWDDVAARLEERFGVSESRAELIARDQVGKLNGQINEQRQSDLGITSYTWRTAGDERVRPEHEERDGEVFSWADPPEGGHPGEAVQCRCYADPILPGEIEQREAA